MYDEHIMHAQGLSQYGNGFLAKFEAAACPNQLLEEVTLVDTPGVLSGEKQRIEVLCPQCCCVNPPGAPCHQLGLWAVCQILNGLTFSLSMPR